MPRKCDPQGARRRRRCRACRPASDRSNASLTVGRRTNARLAPTDRAPTRTRNHAEIVSSKAKGSRLLGGLHRQPFRLRRRLRASPDPPRSADGCDGRPGCVCDPEPCVLRLRRRRDAESRRQPAPFHGFHTLPEDTLTPLHVIMSLLVTRDGTIYATTIYPFTLLKVESIQAVR